MIRLSAHEKPSRTPLRRGLLLLAGLVLSLSCHSSEETPPAPGGRQAGPEPAGPVAFIVSPKFLAPGETVRVLAAAEAPLEKAAFRIQGPSGNLEPLRPRKGGGPPFWQAAEFMVAEAGAYEIRVASGGRELGRTALSVPSDSPPFPKPGPGVWASERSWTRAEEDLYSAWLEALFADADERSSWDSLDLVLRDPARNLLFNHLGSGEDEPQGRGAVEMRPDCADNPFFLRAYFSWKLGLPFGFRETTRGTLERPPQSLRWLTNESVARGPGTPVAAFNRFLRLVMNTIHSGTARTALEAGESDYYPLPLTRRDLRPGAVFADPYGHTLVVVRWMPQGARTSGLLLAVDAQPDGTIGLKRFWRGNFLFTTREVIGEAGFKAFRPVVREDGRLRPLTNEEIAQGPDYGNFSLRQKGLAADEFYDAMERLINPEPLDAVSTFRDLFAAFHEQLVVRVESVANGEAYMQAHPGTVVPMPSGAGVFQALGLWEDYSTPNRDMRLLIALDTLLEFPDKVARAPERFKASEKQSPAELKAELLKLESAWAEELAITYVRSDGQPQKLPLAEVFKRREALEMAYNPNDGVEVRWGAAEGSEELAVCRRRAPSAQVEKMKALRHWFRERRHPPT